MKILLADAGRPFLEIAKTFVRKSGVEVLSCMNGEELLEIRREKNLDRGAIFFIPTLCRYK